MYFASVVIPSEMLDELLIGPTMFETYFCNLRSLRARSLIECRTQSSTPSSMW